MKSFKQYNEELQTYKDLRAAAEAVDFVFASYVRKDGKYGAWGPSVPSGFDYLQLSFKDKSDMEAAAKKIESMGFNVEIKGKDDSFTKSNRPIYFPGKKLASERIGVLWTIEVRK